MLSYLDIETRPARRIWELSPEDQAYLFSKASPGFNPGDVSKQLTEYRELCDSEGNLAAAHAMPFVHSAESAMALNPAMCAIVCVGLYLDAEARADYAAAEPYVKGSTHPELNKGEAVVITWEPECPAVQLPGVKVIRAEPRSGFAMLADLIGPSKVVTFNGRRFDLPILMTHAAAAGAPFTRNLTPYRYSFDECLDLSDLITGFGAGTPARFGDYCKLFGVPSPKEGAVSGKYVGAAVFDNRFEEVFRYQIADVRALVQLTPKVTHGFGAAMTKRRPYQRQPLRKGAAA